MAVNLVTETGVALATANSYASPGDTAYADGSHFSVDQYFADRMAPASVWFPPVADGQPDPNGEVKKACLITASFFLDYYWRAIFKGQKRTQAQGLCWPRVGATIDEGAYDTAVVFWPGYGKSLSTFIIGTQEIPVQVKMCCAELAARSAQLGNFQFPGQLAPDITADNFAIRQQVGPISVEYRQNFPTVTIYRMCEMLLGPLVRGGGGTVPMVRG